MIEHIISDLNAKFHAMVPEVKRQIHELEDFVIVPGSTFGLDPNVDASLRNDIEKAKYYIILRFSPNGNRQMAIDAFHEMMDKKLNLPSTEDIADEVLPHEDYDQTNNSYDQAIDIDDDGNVMNSVQPFRGSAIGKAKPKYYAVEFRIEAPRALPGHPNLRDQISSSRIWNPNRRVDFRRPNSNFISY